MCARSTRDEPIDYFEESLDLCVPPRAKVAPFGPTPRDHAILREVIDGIRLVGAVLAVGGGVATFSLASQGGAMLRLAGPVAGLIVVPGVLYLIAAAGLVRRRYWAWAMSLMVTVLLMLTLVGVGVYFVAFGDAKGAGFVCPTAVYFAMPVCILVYMARALPVVRDGELLVNKGFHVLPPATGGPSPVQTVRVLKPTTAAEPAFPASRDPAPPSPRHRA
jgi:hypothetical protein